MKTTVEELGNKLPVPVLRGEIGETLIRYHDKFRGNKVNLDKIR